ncbi:uncharacterized protein MELLADRAFT_107226 [Melampsora larici-populina 98AG31]|uniref:Uncharacterized protein n=1 Tax=Melampsora larici-populina (strain 98AG31 / pathotype 3-4-7) TaxID=747676 RepID=F4RP89_MELLP|nr:uncharacterized protein MELLADRAFT_107226 [Melampsora larici-populina 98AG31]EGG05776.1 hypothetical protein MELLADRAFT_107226 [Melampsora larici-populina 98AG31]
MLGYGEVLYAVLGVRYVGLQSYNNTSSSGELVPMHEEISMAIVPSKPTGYILTAGEDRMESVLHNHLDAVTAAAVIDIPFWCIDSADEKITQVLKKHFYAQAKMDLNVGASGQARAKPEKNELTRYLPFNPSRLFEPNFDQITIRVC